MSSEIVVAILTSILKNLSHNDTDDCLLWGHFADVATTHE